MSTFLLDTNICVHLLKNEYGIKEKIAKVGTTSCFLSEITMAELLFGIENSAPTRRSENIKRFDNMEGIQLKNSLNALKKVASARLNLRRKRQTNTSQSPIGTTDPR